MRNRLPSPISTSSPRLSNCCKRVEPTEVDLGSSGVAFRYLLHDEDAENVGEFFTAVPNWKVGEEFLNGDGQRWRILKIVPFMEDDAPYHAMWMVEEVPKP